MEAKLFVSSLFLILVSFSIQSYCEESNQQWQVRNCTYVIYVKTGDRQNAGTSARVSLQLRDRYSNQVNIRNLQNWGLKKDDQWRDQYFKRGNLDVFAVEARCLESEFCSMTLSHDNSGFLPNWYVNYVHVTAVAPQLGCQQLRFPVNAWLAYDQPPYYSTRYGVYLCDDVLYDANVDVKQQAAEK